jgi:hypothetical protein
MSQAGFKLVVNYDQMYADAAGTLDYLNYASSIGMKVIFAMDDPAFWNGSNLLTTFSGLAASCGCSTNQSFIAYVINLVKGNAGLWGYYVVDEAPAADHAQVKAFTDLVHQLDPSHPRLAIQTTENTGGGATGATSILTTFQDTADVIGVDYYPVGSSGNGESVAQTGSVAGAVQSVATQYGKSSAMTLQSFSWSEYSGEGWRCPGDPTCPYPSVTDEESMGAQTLQNSSPALILWYSYFDILHSDSPTQRWSDLSTAAASL